MRKAIGASLYRLQPEKTLFMQCDIQEKFKPAIPLMNALIENTKKLLAAGKILNVPLLVTEQYPERLGKTVAELDIRHACANIPKTKFSMIVGPIKKNMAEMFSGKPQTVVLFGMEVGSICYLPPRAHTSTAPLLPRDRPTFAWSKRPLT
ncbi:blast:Isochorismatase domain-containing protein 1 [Drosophila guanche]|uniref:Blast:Isochorismatase domain-containing protein 1 n=1 Tax=Drosophila guanche TaxID=7266 RepID=A0A3B0K800_DROGU|nr:blast:Isochorismatase domain-containing protein 1 [Drosophila guanche]